MTASLRVGDRVRVAKQARYGGEAFAEPAVGEEGVIIRFIGGHVPVFAPNKAQFHWLIDAECLELVDQEVPQEEVQQAIDSILKTNHNVIPSPKEDT